MYRIPLSYRRVFPTPCAGCIIGFSNTVGIVYPVTNNQFITFLLFSSALILINSKQGVTLYTSKEDIEKISTLMQEIKEGKISRNKNYFTLAKAKEFNRFKRAKLLISLLEDLEKTADIEQHKIAVESRREGLEISLYNPILKYSRKVFVTTAEMELVRSNTGVL